MEGVEWAEWSELSLDILELPLKFNFSCDNFDESIFDIDWDFSISILGDVALSSLDLISELIVLTWEDEMCELSLVQTTIIVDIEEVNQNLEFSFGDGLLSCCFQESE